MEGENGDEVDEEPTVQVLFGNRFEVTDGLFRVRVLELREEVQHDICVEKDFHEEVPSFVNWVGRGSEGHIE